ncbi:hypothetical protein DF185_16980 [Marinifilum breve]|uniref:histidine kinase n=1 Tax=Marinifilum breve TaxID=2184082 RepID=A0A2V3ZUC9_9BACT|nr:ATP-binding protein [Marinifilum breve]PXX98025.1 hypothetical protein DF185_16980 [Marinifilum breve]
MNKILVTLLLVLSIIQANAQEKFRIGAFSYYPAIFMDSDGIVKGFYVDALKEVEEQNNIHFEYVFGSWDMCLERIKNEEIDLLVSVAYTEERSMYMDYGTEPLLTVWGEVYVNADSEIDGILDLEGQKVAIMKADINSWYLQDLTQKLSVNCKFVYAKDSEEVFKMLAYNKVDAGVVNNTFGAAQSRKYTLRSSGIIFNPFDIYFTVKKGKNGEILNLLNNYLKEWKYQSNSVYNNSRQEWSHGEIGSITVFPTWLKNTIILISGVLILLLAFVFFLRYRVNVVTRKVKRTEESFRSAIYFAPFPIMIHAEGGEVITINDAWTDLTGYTRNDIVTVQEWTEKAYGTEGKHVRKLIEELYNSDKIIEGGESEIITTSGNMVIWDFSSAPLGVLDDGRKLVISIAKDVTERKKYEAELIYAKERAEKSDLLKSAFLANMSHEIRTPMNGILGFADLLKTPQLNKEKKTRYLEIISQSGKRMLSIINDIVDISKIESGLIEFNIQESNINNQLEELYNFFKPEFEDKDVELRCCDLLLKKDELIKTDEEKIYAVLTNLLKNAIKYCENGFIDFGCVRKKEWLEFYVKDTGIGIAKDRQKAIFERFIQADIYDVNAKQGAGLGLAIAKSYVEMLGGKIWVESKLGEGANFYFTIPVQPILIQQMSDFATKSSI